MRRRFLKSPHGGLMDSNRLITKAEEYLKNISTEDIDLLKLNDFDYYKKIYNQLNEQLEVLIDFRESMDTKGYTSPYRSLSKYGISTVADISAEEASETHRHNQYFRLKASAKKNILDRVKSAIDAHKIAIGNLEEYGLIRCNNCNKIYKIYELEDECSCNKTDYSFFINDSGNHRIEIIPFLPLAGDYMVKISELSSWGRESFKKVINMLKQERKGSVKTVSLIIRYKENKKLIRKRVTLDSYYVDSYEEEIRKEYGKNVRIEALQFHRTKPAIINDKNTRTALAIGYVKQAELIANKHESELLKENIRNIDNLNKYDEIIKNAKYANPQYLDETDSIEDWRDEKINKDLIKANLKYKDGRYNRTLENDLKSRDLIEKSIFLNIAPSLILWDIFKYYLTTSNDKRKRHSGPFPYIRSEIDRQQRKIFQITYTKAIRLLNEREEENILPINEMDLLLHKKFKIEEHFKNSNMKIDYVALGAAILHKEADISMDDCVETFKKDKKSIEKEINNIDTVAKPKSTKSKMFLDLIKT